MRYALIPFLSGLVILSSPTVGAVPASSPSLDLNNNNWELEDRSDPISLLDKDNEPDLENYVENDATSDPELPNPSPQFHHAHLPVVPQLTKEICQATCGVWPYYGMEYSTECYCGGAILNGGVRVDDGNCSTAYAGNPSQTCGGPGQMSIYYDPAVAGPSDPPTFTGATLLGCYNKMYPLRVLDNGGTNSDTSMTLTLCSEYCYGLNSPQPMMYWGLEGGKDCWCGIDINASATLAPNLNYCGMACTGNELQLCGGSNLIAVYHKI